jgi:hypothetical protein
MAVVSIAVEPPADIRHLIRAASLNGQLVSEFRAAVEGGRPVFDEEMYGHREFHELADELQSLVGMLQSVGVAFIIRENGFEIGPEVLFNILAKGRQRFRPPSV